MDPVVQSEVMWICKMKVELIRFGIGPVEEIQTMCE